MTTTYAEPYSTLRVSEMAEQLIGSEIIKLAGEIREKVKKGEQIYNFTIGDFEPKIFPIPSELTQAIIEAYRNGETNYPAADGIAELRKAVSRFLHIRSGLEYNENQILIAGGARPLIYGIFQAIVDPGDSVIFPVPSWNNNHYCHLTRAKMIAVETTPKNNFMPTASDIKPFIGEASLIALCSPLNPTGTTFYRQQIMEICNLVLEENKKRGPNRKPVYLMYDQIYWLLTFGETAHFEPVSLCPEMKNYTIFVDGISKSFAATGVRIGWSFGPQRVINKMRSILSHVGAWAPKAEQVACANYLVQDDKVDSFLDGFRASISNRLVAFYRGFKQLKEEGFKVDVIAPQAAMYLAVQFNLNGMVYPDGTKLDSTEKITQYLLNDARIALVPFYAFGASTNSNWYRLSVGTASMKDIDGFFVNLRKALEQLK